MIEQIFTFYILPLLIFFFISSDIYIREQEKEIHFKELLHEVVEAGKSKIFKVGQEVQT